MVKGELPGVQALTFAGNVLFEPSVPVNTVPADGPVTAQ
jgi:hypothetical protein